MVFLEFVNFRMTIERSQRASCFTITPFAYGV